MTIDPRTFQAMAIQGGLKFWLKTGMKVNTAYTLTNMLKTAEAITGQKYKRSREQAELAVMDLEKWIEEKQK